jgi:transposase
MKHLDARLLQPVIQQKLRQNAVELFLNSVNPTDISKQLGASRQSVYNWIRRHSESGKQGLKIHKRGRPKGTQLQPWQSAQIVNLITHSCPDELSMPFFLWTRGSVGLLILQKFDIKLSKWTVGRYLSKWGFSPQKPARRAIEQDPKAIEKWFKFEYPSIQNAARKTKQQFIGVMRWVYDLITMWEKHMG